MRKFLLVIVITLIFSVVLILRQAEDRAGRERVTYSDRPVAASSRLAELLGDDGNAGFARAIEAREFRFPDDHGPHPEFRNEWWYVTGNLDAETGDRFGFELTVFRFSLTPEPIEDPSAWRSNQVYIGHFAVTDAARRRFHVAERYSRGSLGLAGAVAEPFRVWLEDWEITASDEPGFSGAPWRLRAADGDVLIDVELHSSKAPVLNGIDGLSQKSAGPGSASYYYSLTRLETHGSLQVAGRRYAVSGLSWLDREWGSNALAPDQSGWDWFALQLDDGTELMFYNLRRQDGSQDVMSAGTHVGSDGRAAYLSRDDVIIDVLAYWDSPAGGRYPNAWQLGVPDLGLSLRIEPVLAAQELATNVRYWEGAVDVSGSRAGRTVGGRGYVELTGYATTPDGPSERGDHLE